MSANIRNACCRQLQRIYYMWYLSSYGFPGYYIHTTDPIQKNIFMKVRFPKVLLAHTSTTYLATRLSALCRLLTVKLCGSLRTAGGWGSSTYTSQNIITQHEYVRHCCTEQARLGLWQCMVSEVNSTSIPLTDISSFTVYLLPKLTAGLVWSSTSEN